MYYDVDYSDVAPVKNKALQQTDEENYSSLLMEDKGFSVTAMSRLHNLLTHSAVQCFSMLLVMISHCCAMMFSRLITTFANVQNEYMLVLKDLKEPKESGKSVLVDDLFHITYH